MTTTWNFQADVARTQGAHLTASSVPTNPAAGLGIENKHGIRWNVFAVQPIPQHSLHANEAYIRGKDLIVAFNQAPQDKFAFQLDWHILETSDIQAIGIELWASVQTDLLDSAPVMNVSSSSPSGECWEVHQHRDLFPSDNSVDESSESQVGPAALIARTSEQTGIWLIQPSDQCHTELISTPSDGKQQLQLFGHFMEKGVIRRARMRFYVADGQVTEQQIRSLYHAFENSPLPLTA